MSEILEQAKALQIALNKWSEASAHQLRGVDMNDDAHLARESAFWHAGVIGGMALRLERVVQQRDERIQQLEHDQRELVEAMVKGIKAGLAGAPDGLDMCRCGHARAAHQNLAGKNECRSSGCLCGEFRR